MTVLVATEGGAAGQELLAAAKILAMTAGWKVAVVHVRPTADDPPLDLPAALLEGVAVTEAEGDPAAEVLRLAAGDDIKVVAFALRDDERSGHGHVADALLRSSPKALFVLRPGMPPLQSLRRLLVPLEGSPSSSDAMHFADDAFCAPGREIVLLHVVTSDSPAEPGSMPAPRMVDQEHYEWASWQEEFRMRFAQCPKGGRHRVILRVGEASQTIVTEASSPGVEMVVLSWAQSLDEGRARQVRHMIAESPRPLLLVQSRPG